MIWTKHSSCPARTSCGILSSVHQVAEVWPSTTSDLLYCSSCTPGSCVRYRTSGPVPRASSWDIHSLIRADTCPQRAAKAPLHIAVDVLGMSIWFANLRHRGCLNTKLAGGHKVCAWVGRWESSRPRHVIVCPHSFRAEPRGGEERREDLPVHAPQAAAHLVKPAWGELAPARHWPPRGRDLSFLPTHSPDFDECF